MSLLDKPTFGKAPVVLVEWEDAAFSPTTCETAKELMSNLNVLMQRSVGFLVSRTKSIIVIAQSQNCQECDRAEKEPTYNDVLQIPAGMVRKVTTLRRGA